MIRNIYALLVGINDYMGNVPGLSGCVNDVKSMTEFLQQRTRESEFALKPLVLTSGDRDNPNETKPTRRAVIDGFRNHLCRAGSDDVALFYYSGHGSQEKTPHELEHLEPDHLDETIVCYDSRTAGSWDLADKELGLLIAEVARKQPHIVIILDSCHSGSGTRAPAEPGVRLAPGDKRERPLATFEGYAQLQQQKAAATDQPNTGDWLILPEGGHVLISACRPEEVANERFLEDGVHGVMSHYLLDTLRRGGASLTYRDIYARIETLVRNQVAQQNPLVEATDVKLLQQPFLGGAIKPQPPYFTVTYSTQKGWVIDGGTVNGIAAPQDGETTTLALFDETVDLANVSKMDQAAGWAKVKVVAPGESQVDLTLKSGAKPDRKVGFKGIVVSQPTPPVWVWLQGEEAGLALVRATLQPAGVDFVPSLIVRELTAQDISAAVASAGKQIKPQVLAPLTLIARGGCYYIRRTDDAYPLTAPIGQGYTKSAAQIAVASLERVAFWLHLAQLDNKTSALPRDAVTMEFYAAKEDGSPGERLDTTGGTIRLSYKKENDKWVMPSFMLRLVNTSNRRVYCTLLDMTESFAIQTAGLLKGGGEWLAPKGEVGSDIWAYTYYKGRPIPAAIDSALLKQGVVSYRDILKLIVSTNAVKSDGLEREELNVTITKGLGPQVKSADMDVPKSTLARLYSRLQTRSVGDAAEPDDTIDDFTASQVTITTVYPGNSITLPAAGEEKELWDTVSIQGHPALKGNARLTTWAEGTRNVGNLAVPPVFRQYPQLGSPFQLSGYRDGAAGLAVLELDVEGDGYQQVSRANPLVLKLETRTAPDEYILPLGFDPAANLFLPLGRSKLSAEGTAIIIDQLPAPTADSSGTRDIKSSIKLFFQKVVGDKLHLDAATTRLAAATVNDKREVEYDSSPVSVAAKVQAAHNILLYIHGFTGDTRGLVASAHGLPVAGVDPSPALADRYDLILAYDYESINTSVERTAVAFKRDLAAVGLCAGHDKVLHVIAHSLGCLVLRCFIEREGGKQVVSKAVLVGPPNAGTPWATLEDFAIVALGAAINGLAAMIWPPAAIPALVGTIGSIVAGAETVDTTLDELKPDSDLYAKLNASEDPKIPYVVIAGNTDKIHSSAPANARGDRTRLEQLVTRLASKETRNAVLGMAFFGKPNDVSFSVESMTSLPAAWKPAVKIQEVASDHSSYFVGEAGLRAIAQALA